MGNEWRALHNTHPKFCTNNKTEIFQSKTIYIIENIEKNIKIC